jgi:hypothetical protein
MFLVWILELLADGAAPLVVAGGINDQIKKRLGYFSWFNRLSVQAAPVPPPLGVNRISNPRLVNIAVTLESLGFPSSESMS